MRSNGSAVGILNWFGVHGTVVGENLKLVSFDNRGYASLGFERIMKTDDRATPRVDSFVAPFPQVDQGDASSRTTCRRARNSPRSSTRGLRTSSDPGRWPPCSRSCATAVSNRKARTMSTVIRSCRTHPIAGDLPLPRAFSTLMTDVPATAAPSETITAEFQSGHPRDDLRTQQSYVCAERQETDGHWGAVAEDRDPERWFVWKPALSGALPVPLRPELPLPPIPSYLPGNQAVDQSFRMVVRPTLGCETPRVRLSNLVGDRWPGADRTAPRRSGDPAGQQPRGAVRRPARGRDRTGRGSDRGIDVITPDSPGAIVAIGDSSAGGAYSVPETNMRWPDWFQAGVNLTGRTMVVATNQGSGSGRRLGPPCHRDI